MPSRPEDDDRPRRSPGGGDRRPSREGRPRSDRARSAGDDRRPRPSSGGRDGAPRGGAARGAGRTGGARSTGRPARPGDERRGENRGRSTGRPDARGGQRSSGSSDRPYRSRDGGSGRDGDRPYRSREGAPGRDGDRPLERGPRPPIKGKRRTFDVDSRPNERERTRPEGGDAPAGERWVDEGPVRKAAGDAVDRGGRRPKARSGTGSSRGRDGAPKPTGRSSQRRAERATKRVEGALDIDRDRLRRRLGQTRADRTLARIGEATAGYAEDRFEDVRKTLKPIAELMPEEPAVRELYGLALYRLGRWRLAVEELEEFARRSGSTEQHPVLADCYRALGQHGRVQELWDEIAEASLAAPLVAEGRIVYAGSLADRGMLVEAIAVLEAGALGDKPLKDHHLRMRYVLGDLYDRAGEQQSARRWFESVASTDPAFFDVRDRLRQL